MKQNERTSMDTFNPGEYCRFSNEEIPHILDILRANGHDVIDNEYPYGEDCVFCFPTGGMSHFARSLMTDGFVNYTELPRHEFMVKALRIGWRLGARMIDIPQQQRQHIIDELITLEVELTNDIEKTLSDIPYLEWCRRLCIEPIVEPKQGLPENGWAILCTEESMAHPMWYVMVKSVSLVSKLRNDKFNGWCIESYYGMKENGTGDCDSTLKNFGKHAKQITIDDWCQMTGNTPKPTGHVGGQIPDELKHDDFSVELDPKVGENTSIVEKSFPTPEEMCKQPFEYFTELSESISYAASHWKISQGWTNHLQRINEVCQQLLDTRKVDSVACFAFDALKPFEVSNDGEEWLSQNTAMDEDFVFVQVTTDGYALFDHGKIGPVVWRYIRNIQVPKPPIFTFTFDPEYGDDLYQPISDAYDDFFGHIST